MGHEGVGVKPEFIKYLEEFHILMKQTSIEISKWINWGLNVVSDVDDSWATTSDSNLNSLKIMIRAFQTIHVPCYVKPL